VTLLPSDSVRITVTWYHVTVTRVVMENLLATVSTLGHVMGDARDDDAGEAGHDRSAINEAQSIMSP